MTVAPASVGFTFKNSALYNPNWDLPTYGDGAYQIRPSLVSVSER